MNATRHQIASDHISVAPADIPVRLVARVIDVLLLVAITGTLGMGIGFGYDWLAISAAIVLFYFALFDTLAGATPGKFVMSLRVIGPDGNRPTLRQSVARESFVIPGAVPFVGPFLALGAWVWIFLTVRSSPLRQGKHDMLAGGTRVVRQFS
jgi:uncharacterized RDD family membrane protein YckC